MDRTRWPSNAPRHQRWLSRHVALACCALLAWACSDDGGDTSGAAGSDAGAAADSAEVEDAGSGGGPITVEGPAVDSEAFNVPIQVLIENRQQQLTLRGTILKPVTCQSATPCPAVVVIGDRDSDAHPAYQGPGTLLAKATESVVLIFNLPGTGSGALKSQGPDDVGGDVQATAVKEATRIMKAKAYVDDDRVGLLTIGVGLVSAARALQIHGANSLSFIHFLVDVEGPLDRCAISVAPANPEQGVGPGDGPGVSATACGFDSIPQSAQYPPGVDGVPDAIVCSQSAWPISETGEFCNTTWWSTREPAASLPKLSTALRYQRVQFAVDHRLPTTNSARRAFKAMAASASSFYLVNDIKPCTPPFGEADCQNLGCWLDTEWGNGFGPAPFRPATGFREVSLDALFGKILPRFVDRMLDESVVCD